jgi:Papain family cysteine protease
MKKLLMLTLALGSFSVVLMGQKNNPQVMPTAKGPFKVDDTRLIDQYLKVVEGIGSSRDMLAEQSLKAYMMPPRKAGSTANSATYALASALEFYVNLNNNYKDNLSPDFIRLSQNNPNAEQCLDFLGSTGTVSAAILPFDSPNLTPSVYSAMKYRIKQYLKLFSTDTRPQQKMFDIRKAITRGNPVVVEMQITQEFKTLKQSRFWQPTTDKTPIGKHFVVVVGFDEDKKAVEILNSWGREWANNGYVWVSYEDFGVFASNGFVLIP